MASRSFSEVMTVLAETAGQLSVMMESMAMNAMLPEQASEMSAMGEVLKDIALRSAKIADAKPALVVN